MLTKSQNFGTVLSVGPRLKKFMDAGYGYSLLWSEQYPGQEKPTSDGLGEFEHTRRWIEVAPLEEVFDLWCRGQNLPGFSDIILSAVEAFNKVYVNGGAAEKRRQP